MAAFDRPRVYKKLHLVAKGAGLLTEEGGGAQAPSSPGYTSLHLAIKYTPHIKTGPYGRTGGCLIFPLNIGPSIKKK